MSSDSANDVGRGLRLRPLNLVLCPETVDYQVAIVEEVGEGGRMGGWLDGW